MILLRKSLAALLATAVGLAPARAALVERPVGPVLSAAPTALPPLVVVPLTAPAPGSAPQLSPAVLATPLAAPAPAAAAAAAAAEPSATPFTVVARAAGGPVEPARGNRTAALDDLFDGEVKRSFLAPAVAAALIVPFSSSFHELGHYLAARAIGRTARMHVDKVLIDDLDSASYPRRLLVSAAGPAFSFALAGAAAGSALAVAANPWTTFALWLYAGLNAMFGATNLMPFRGLGVVGEAGVSDGTHLRDDWRAWRAARAAAGAPTRKNLEKDDRRAAVAKEEDAAVLESRVARLDAPSEDRDAIAEFTRRTMALSVRFAALSPADLRATTARLRRRRRAGESLDALLPEAFAAAREAMARALGKKPYAEQVMAAAALHRGRAVEQRTGEGKTLSIGLAAYLNALDGPVDVHTFNPYLAARDAAEIGRPLALLGVTAGALDGRDEAYLFSGRLNAVRHESEKDLKRVSRRELYRGADVIYGHTNAFVFDELGDHDAASRAKTMRASRRRRFAIVDEADAAMMEEAGSDFRIVSRDGAAPVDYAFLYALTGGWKPGEDYTLDEKSQSVALRPKARAFLAALSAANPGLPDAPHLELYARNALKARSLLKLDRDYVVARDSVVILDPHTGRLMDGRQWEDGLHRFVEIKEGLRPDDDARLSSHMSLDAYFRGYRKAGAITGTLEGAQREFADAYGLPAVRVPPHRPSIRDDRPDRLYRTATAKLAAVVADAAAARRAGRPVLIGARDVAESSRLARLLSEAGEKFELLNGLQNDEAAIVARAGRAGALTVATQLAGRGTDIQLTADARKAGGLLVLLTTMSESARVDLQYRGRAGRQGDPGETRLFVSLEDDVLLRRASEPERAALAAAVFEDGAEVSGPEAELLRAVQSRAEREDSDLRSIQRIKDDRLAPVRERYFARRALWRALPLPGSGLMLAALHRGWGDFLAEHEDAWRLSTEGPSPEDVASSYRRLVLRPALEALQPQRVLAAAARGAYDAVADYFAESFYATASRWVARHVLSPVTFKSLSMAASLLGKIRLVRATPPLLRIALRLRPDDWRERARLADALYALGRYDEAAGEYQTFLESFWSKSQQFDSEERRVMEIVIRNLALAFEARARGKTGVARALDLALADDLAPNAARESALERARSSLTEAERAVANDRPPFMKIVYLDKARTAVDRGDFANAAYYFDHVIRMAPTSATAFIGRGWAEHGLKEADASRSDFGEALRLRILDSRQFENMRLSYSLASGASLDAARLEAAFALLWSDEDAEQTAPAAGPGAKRAAEEARQEGRRRLEAGDARGALSWLDIAVRRNPRDSRAYDDRGIAHFRLGDHRAAYVDFVDSLMWGILDDDGNWSQLIVGHETRAQWTPGPGAIAAFVRALKSL